MVLVTSPALAQQAITITSPTEGTKVAPGQTFTVQVATNAVFKTVQVIAEEMTITPPVTSPPYLFSVTAPSNLIGQKMVTALGVASPEHGVFSPSVTIDLETDARVTSLSVTPL